MSRLAPFGRKAAGFFVDDAFLGGGTILSVLVASLCRVTLGARPLVAGALLAVGCVLALILSVVRAASRRPS